MTVRERISRSSFLLPVAILVSAAVWGVEGIGDTSVWVGYGLCLLMTYMLMELNNRNALLRVRSRMVSTVFLLITTAMPFLHVADWYWLPSLCLIGSFFLLFGSYQKARPEGEVFHAFLLVAVGSLLLPPMLGLLPLFYVSMLFSLRSLTWRSFFAGLFGLALPYIIYIGWRVYDGSTNEAVALFLSASPILPRLSDWPLPKMVNAGFLLFQILLGLIHYYRTNFNDKIRVRMTYYTMELPLLAIVGAFPFFPQFTDAFFLLSLTTAAPFIGHYWALARGRGWMTAWFFLNTLLLISLGVANYFYF